MRKTGTLQADCGPARALRIFTLVTMVLMAPDAVAGQSFYEATEVTGNLQFSFSNPGARSLAMGGAFAGLADDATAAYANPAGLIQLYRPEVSAEFRDWSFSTLFTERGRTSGEVTGMGIDTVEGILTAETTQRASDFEIDDNIIAGTVAALRGLADVGEILPQGRKPFRVPDVWGVGASYRPTENLVFMVEYDLVRYSHLFGGDQEVEGAGRFFQEDGEEFRLGAEYTLWHMKLAPTFRFGMWLDPDHKVRFEQEGDSRDAQFLAALFPAGEDELHVTGGVGFVFGQRLQLDAAFDLSDRIDTVSASLVARF